MHDTAPHFSRTCNSLLKQSRYNSKKWNKKKPSS